MAGNMQPKEVRKLSEKYRAIILFDADDDTQAQDKATKAARAARGSVDRLTVRRETWGAVETPSLMTGATKEPEGQPS
jgi:hypothetical protein